MAGLGLHVGRDAELDVLREYVSRLAEGQGGTVWIEGEPGIGKSLLIDTALTHPASAGTRTIRMAAGQLTQAFALCVFADGLGVRQNPDDRARTEIADLLAGAGRRVDAVLAASERLVALIEMECSKSPVILVCEDLQWADEASLGVWHRLISVANQAPLLLVSSCRPVPHRDTVDQLRSAVERNPGSAVIELGPVEMSTAVEMAGALLSATPGATLTQELGRAGGNPLYLRELLDALVREGMVRIDAGAAELAGPLGSDLPTLSSAIARRLGFLSPRARSVLRAGAVLGVRFSIRDLAIVSGCPMPELTPIVSEGFRAGVLAEDGAELRFRHPLIGQALHDEVPVAVRVGLHSQAAHELATEGAGWDLVARHLLAEPGVIDAWAVDWLVTIPATALYAQPATAADLIGRARALTFAGDPRRSVLTTRLATLLRMLRRPEDLVELGTEALPAVTEPHLIGEIAWNLGRGFQMTYRGDEGIAMIDRVLDGPDPGAPWRSRLIAQRALLCVTSGRFDGFTEQVEEAIAAGARDDDPVTIGWALIALLQIRSGLDALECVERGLAVLVGEDPESIDLRLLFLANRLVVFMNLNRTADFEGALGPTVTLAESVGAPRLVEIHLAAAQYFDSVGDWDQSLLHLSQMGERLTPYQAIHQHGVSALIAIRRGDRPTAEEHLAAVSEISYLASLDFIIAAAELTRAKALLAEAEGNLDLAVEVLAVAWLDPRVDAGEHGRFVRSSLLPELVRLAIAAGDWETARSVVDLAEADVARGSDWQIAARAAMCRGMLDAEPTLILDAADRFDAVGQRSEAAFAAQEASIGLAEAGDLGSARAAFDRASRIYEELGAVLDLRRLRARARPFGIRPGARRPHRRAVTGWEALTAAEHGVASLVAEGMSNPQIASQLYISRRTVAAHVAHIMQKLQVRSRHEIGRGAHLESSVRG